MSQSSDKSAERGSAIEDVITATQVQKLCATLDIEARTPSLGDPLPPGWQRIFFANALPLRRLGPSGMAPEMEAGVPDPLPLRLFAGSRTRFYRPLRIGDTARQVSELVSMTPKEGRSGKLVFATYRHTISVADRVAIEDEWDIVFREKITGDTPKPLAGQPVRTDATWERNVIPTNVMLFRFSAVTFNSDRLHYDYPYATGGEGYPGLLVQGPLTAIFLLELVREHNANATVASFEMRAKAPLFAGRAFRALGRLSDDGTRCELWAATPENTVAMEASATLA